VCKPRCFRVLFVNPANQGTRHFSNPPGGALNKKKNRNDFAARVVMGGRVRVGFRPVGLGFSVVNTTPTAGAARSQVHSAARGVFDRY
jgi:hypothetical protein